MRKNRKRFACIVAFVAIAVCCAGGFAYKCHLDRNTHTLTVHNDTGKEISMLLIFWPDESFILKRNLKANKSVTVYHHPSTEGVSEIFYKPHREHEWCHIKNSEYMCAYLQTEEDVHLDAS